MPGTYAACNLPLAEAPVLRWRISCTGELVTGPEETFASALAELTLMAKDVKTARTVADRVVREHPVIVG